MINPHELLTETTPIGTYGNTCANEFIWIPSKVFIQKGSKGVVKIVSCTEGASYKFFTLKKNTESNFTIVDTYNHDVNANVNIDYYEVSAIEHDVYFGFYSSNKGIAYSSSQKGVTTALTLQSQNNGNTLTHRFLKNTLWSTENGTKNAITLRTEATSGHLVGSDGVLDTISFGNNATELNA